MMLAGKRVLAHDIVVVVAVNMVLRSVHYARSVWVIVGMIVILVVVILVIVVLVAELVGNVFAARILNTEI